MRVADTVSINYGLLALTTSGSRHWLGFMGFTVCFAIIEIFSALTDISFATVYFINLTNTVMSYECQNRWDEYEDEPIDNSCEEELYTPEEKLRQQAALSLGDDPVREYGLIEPDMEAEKSAEEIAYENKLKHSRGWYRKDTFSTIPKQRSKR